MNTVVAKEVVAGWGLFDRTTGETLGLYLTKGGAKAARTSVNGYTREDPRLPIGYYPLARRLRGEHLVSIAPVYAIVTVGL